MNVFGCPDNIAWIWVYEKGITNSDGTELEPKEVGLGKKEGSQGANEGVSRLP